MNRYPVWKYAIIVVALLLGALYTLPNFFGEAPAVQVSSGKATVKVAYLGDDSYTRSTATKKVTVKAPKATKKNKKRKK